MADSTDLILRNREGIRAIASQAKEYQSAIATCTDEFERGLLIAEGMATLRTSMTPQVMKPIMALQGTPLGFVTDKDRSGGYDEATVRDCTIEAWLRGFYHCGNEFNIISGRFYGAKAGFERLVRRHEGVTNFQIHTGVPEINGGNALVQVVASWELNGAPDRIERTKRKLSDGSEIDLRVPVRVNAGMGIDAIIGKVHRKVFAEIYQRMTGQTIPDGEATDAPIDAQVVNTKLRKSALFDDKTGGQQPGSADDQESVVVEYQVALDGAEDRDAVRAIVGKARDDRRMTPETRTTVMDLAGKTHKRLAGKQS